MIFAVSKDTKLSIFEGSDSKMALSERTEKELEIMRIVDLTVVLLFWK
jgi:hypothetical protein